MTVGVHSINAARDCTPRVQSRENLLSPWNVQTHKSKGKKYHVILWDCIEIPSTTLQAKN